jgi:hypothetical protein
VLAWLFASIPWFNSKILGIYGFYRKKNVIKGSNNKGNNNKGNTKKENNLIKPLWLTMLESFFLYILIVLLGFIVESWNGVRFNQAWQFWVVIVCIWTVLVFPVVAWFKLRKQ